MASSKRGRPQPFAFVLTPFRPEFDDVYHIAIKPACTRAEVRCERVDEQIFNESIVERIYGQISAADVVIVDLTGRNPNVFYETGVAHAMGKMVILLTKDLSDVPFDLRNFHLLIYGNNLRALELELEERLRKLFDQLRRRRPTPRSKGVPSTPAPAAATRKPKRVSAGRKKLSRTQLLISYSHRDEKWLKRLQIHLRPLEREKQVVRWDDSMLDAGEEWRERIREAVAKAKVAVLFVSADFLASDFIHTNELPPLLAAAQSDGALIMPLIVSPSRFEQIKNLSRFQAFNPPSKPLIEMPRGQQEQLFVKAATRIAEVLDACAG